MGVFVRYGFYKTHNDALPQVQVESHHPTWTAVNQALLAPARVRNGAWVDSKWKKMEGWCGLPMVNDQ